MSISVIDQVGFLVAQRVDNSTSEHMDGTGAVGEASRGRELGGCRAAKRQAADGRVLLGHRLWEGPGGLVGVGRQQCGPASWADQGENTAGREL